MTGNPNLIVDAAIDGLRRHAPFDRMERESLEYLARNLRLAYFAKGKRIAGPEDGIARTLYIVQRGFVSARSVTLPVQDTLEYYPGESFPIASVFGKRPTNYVFTATEDTFCYETDAHVVAELVRRSPPFGEFCASRTGAMMQRSFTHIRTYFAQEAAGREPMNASLRDLLHRSPVSCHSGESTAQALLAMQRNKVGSIVVTNSDGAPEGIFTERDLLRHTVSGFLDTGKPIETYMTPEPRTLPATATAADAALMMLKFGIRHVVVTEGIKLAGVVSERDLFSLQRTSMREVVHAIEIAADTRSLTEVAAGIRKLTRNMLAQGVSAEQLAQFISGLNDRLSRRILDLESIRHGISGMNVCWLSIGSEGRNEQTFATDQDNGLVFSAVDSPVEARARLLAFARAVNEALDRCGFPLCKGNIMASNPEWCLSLEEWQERFGDWIRNPLPQPLLHATIFFDFRALWGDEGLVYRLRTWLNGAVAGNDRFLRAMAQNAIASQPPLGLFTDFVTSGGQGEPRTLDLKGQGTRPFVDAARIYALASGLDQTGTATRLRISGERLGVPSEEIEAMVEAFHFIQLLRLRHQHAMDAASAEPNRIDPDTLNELDRRILKEAFRQARKLQTRLALDYQL